MKYWLEVVFALVSGVFATAFRSLSKKVQEKSIQDSAMKEAILAMLDDNMGNLFYACKQKRYATMEEERRYHRMYNAYHAMGGNGPVTVQYEHFKKFEIREE